VKTLKGKHKAYQHRTGSLKGADLARTGERSLSKRGGDLQKGGGKDESSILHTVLPRRKPTRKYAACADIYLKEKGERK